MTVARDYTVKEKSRMLQAEEAFGLSVGSHKKLPSSSAYIYNEDLLLCVYCVITLSKSP